MADTLQSIGISDAAAAFENILSGKPGNEDAESDALNEAPADEAEAVEGDSDADETASEEVAAEDDAATDEDNPDAEGEEQPLYTVKINGKEETVTLDEALKGYQRNVDYTRKTEALSHERKALVEERGGFEAERQAVMQERQQYAQMLGALQQQLQSAMQREPNWEELYRTDPLEYVRQKDLYREAQDRMAAASVEQQRVMALQAQEQAKYLQTMVQQNRDKLLEAVPEWKDKKKWEADRPKLVEYGKTLGFSEEELQQTYDARAVVALRKAMLYDQLVANKPKPTVPQVPKSSAAGSAERAPKPTSDVTKAKQRLAKSGRVADAATIFEALL